MQSMQHGRHGGKCVQGHPLARVTNTKKTRTTGRIRAILSRRGAHRGSR